MSTLKSSTLSALTQCTDFQILCCALTRNYDRNCHCGSSPAINILLRTVNSLHIVAIKSYKSYKNYKMTPWLMTNAGYVENVPTLFSAWRRLFHYVAKMAAVEYKKCPLIHTSRFDRFEYTIRVLSVHFFFGIGAWITFTFKLFYLDPNLQRRKKIQTFWEEILIG